MVTREEIAESEQKLRQVESEAQRVLRQKTPERKFGASVQARREQLVINKQRARQIVTQVEQQREVLGRASRQIESRDATIRQAQQDRDNIRSDLSIVRKAIARRNPRFLSTNTQRRLFRQVASGLGEDEIISRAEERFQQTLSTQEREIVLTQVRSGAPVITPDPISLEDPRVLDRRSVQVQVEEPRFTAERVSSSLSPISGQDPTVAERRFEQSIIAEGRDAAPLELERADPQSFPLTRTERRVGQIQQTLRETDEQISRGARRAGLTDENFERLDIALTAPTLLDLTASSRGLTPRIESSRREIVSGGLIGQFKDVRDKPIKNIVLLPAGGVLFKGAFKGAGLVTKTKPIQSFLSTKTGALTSKTALLGGGGSLLAVGSFDTAKEIRGKTSRKTGEIVGIRSKDLAIINLGALSAGPLTRSARKGTRDLTGATKGLIDDSRFFRTVGDLPSFPAPRPSGFSRRLTRGRFRLETAPQFPTPRLDLGVLGRAPSRQQRLFQRGEIKQAKLTQNLLGKRDLGLLGRAPLKQERIRQQTEIDFGKITGLRDLRKAFRTSPTFNLPKRFDLLKTARPGKLQRTSARFIREDIRAAQFRDLTTRNILGPEFKRRGFLIKGPEFAAKKFKSDAQIKSTTDKLLGIDKENVLGARLKQGQIFSLKPSKEQLRSLKLFKSQKDISSAIGKRLDKPLKDIRKQSLENFQQKSLGQSLIQESKKERLVQAAKKQLPVFEIVALKQLKLPKGLLKSQKQVTKLITKQKPLTQQIEKQASESLEGLPRSVGGRGLTETQIRAAQGGPIRARSLVASEELTATSPFAAITPPKLSTQDKQLLGIQQRTKTRSLTPGRTRTFAASPKATQRQAFFPSFKLSERSFLGLGSAQRPRQIPAQRQGPLQLQGLNFGQLFRQASLLGQPQRPRIPSLRLTPRRPPRRAPPILLPLRTRGRPLVQRRRAKPQREAILITPTFTQKILGISPIKFKRRPLRI